MKLKSDVKIVKGWMSFFPSHRILVRSAYTLEESIQSPMKYDLTLIS